MYFVARYPAFVEFSGRARQLGVIFDFSFEWSRIRDAGAISIAPFFLGAVARWVRTSLVNQGGEGFLVFYLGHPLDSAGFVVAAFVDEGMAGIAAKREIVGQVCIQSFVDQKMDTRLLQFRNF